jgi:hypothetical protein
MKLWLLKKVRTFYLVANHLVQFTYLANQEHVLNSVVSASFDISSQSRAGVKLCSVEQVFTYLGNGEHVLNYVVLSKCCLWSKFFYRFTFKTWCAMWAWRCSYCCPWGESSLQILHTKRQIVQLKLPIWFNGWEGHLVWPSNARVSSSIGVKSQVPFLKKIKL